MSDKIRISLDATVLYLIVTISTVLGGLAYSEWRIRRFRAHFASTALQTLQDAFFDEDVVESENGTKRVLLRPNARTKAFLGAVVPSLVELGLATVKVRLPKFAPVNPATGQLDFTAGIAAKFADGKNVKPEEIAKALFMQFGMPLLEQKLVPMLQGLTANVGIGTPSQEKETPNPYLKELGQ